MSLNVAYTENVDFEYWHIADLEKSKFVRLNESGDLQIIDGKEILPVADWKFVDPELPSGVHKIGTF